MFTIPLMIAITPDTLIKECCFKITIYHNPRCSKSRQTLELLQSRDIEPEIVLYLETPPSADTLRTLLGKLGISARQLARWRDLS